MSTVGFLLLTLGCVTMCSHIHYDYHLVNQKKTWQEAQSYCRATYTDLATIPSLSDARRLMDMIEKSGVTEGIWIGLRDTNKPSWRWVDINRMTHESLEFTCEISVPDPSYGCGVAGRDGSFTATGCGSRLPYVCQEHESSEMRFYEKNATWYEALDNCRQEDMELASARTEDEKKALQKILDNEPGQTPLWIGFFRDFWKWSDDSDSSFRYWGPNGLGNIVGCAMFNPSSKTWKLDNCANAHPFYCYNGQSMRKMQTVRLEVKANSLVNFSDAAVTEAILSQLQNKFSDSGVKLRWKVQPDGKIFKKKEEDDDE